MTIMNETEGVIKYQLHHTDMPLANDIDTTGLNAWRTVMFKLNLIGQNPHRYNGYGFGNISQRLSTSDLQFIISGTQTGHLSVLSRHDYCQVRQASPQTNEIVSCGECKPSSEALTHASVYLQNPQIQAVIHVHCPEIWQHTHDLNLAHTAADIAYGTPEMAEAVTELFKSAHWQQTTVFTMLGHEDGVVAFGNSLKQAGCALITQLALALEIE
jgi:ribulose-5-phosphate 4-epimerase/fuculose-1-phosphate aldolase